MVDRIQVYFVLYGGMHCKQTFLYPGFRLYIHRFLLCLWGGGGEGYIGFPSLSHDYCFYGQITKKAVEQFVGRLFAKNT